MEHDAGILILLFVSLALVVGAATRHALKGTPIPYTVALLLIGMGAGLAERAGILERLLPMLGGAVDLISKIEPHLILFLFLPTLIFESAFAMETHLFRRIFSQIAILAVPGMLFCSMLTGVFAHATFPWQWSWAVALMFGALISATDPVAVVALLREQSSRKRLETLIDGESLLNDGTAIVLFALFYGFVVSPDAGHFSLAGTVGEFGWVVVMGLVIGAVLAMVALAWVSRIFNDAMIEITVTVASAYLVFFVAEELFHVSGVVGIVVLALMFASFGRTRISPEVAGFLHHFWEVMAYIANTLIFLVVGIVIADSVRISGGGDWLMLGLLYLFLQVVRATMVVLFMPVLQRIGVGITREKSIVLVWGGLRGAVSLALALVVVQDPRVPAGVGDTILFLTAGVVVLTILVNGMTMPLVFRRLGLDRLPAAKQATIDKARLSIHEELADLLPTLHKNQFLQAADWGRIDSLALAAPGPAAEADQQDLETAYRRRLLEAERKYYLTLLKDGMLSSAAFGKLIDAVERALDGEPQIAPRPELQRLLATPPLLERVVRVPALRKLALTMSFERMATGYDAARGFIQAQDAISEYLAQLAPDEASRQRAHDEILQNQRETYARIEQLRAAFPEVLARMETQAATRMLLNRERAVIHRLADDGVLDTPEVERMVAEVEERMQALRHVPVRERNLQPKAVLANLPAFMTQPDEVLEQLAAAVEQRLYAAGERLIEPEKTQPGLLVLVRGAVDVLGRNDGAEQLLAVRGAGACLGAESLLSGDFQYAARAATPVEALLLPAEALRQLIKAYPELREALRGAAILPEGGPVTAQAR